MNNTNARQLIDNSKTMPETDPIYPWGDGRRYNSYSGYFRRLFGTRMQKLSVNAGFTCPNRDGSLSFGGCTFCNNDAFSPSYCTPQKNVRQQLEEGIEFHRKRYRSAEKYLAYFQSYTNTYAPVERLKEIFSQAFELPQIAGIIVGTRPDCIDERKLDYFASLAEHYYVVIEYGIESCYDTTLASINRGHDFACARRALELTAARGIHTGAHFILGLPGETRQMMLDQTDAINTLPLNTVKFHQLQLFKNTPMAEEFTRHPERFHFPDKETYIDFFIDMLERLRPDLVIERFAGEAPPRFHAGPTWGLIRNEQLWNLFEKRLEERDTRQGRLYPGKTE